MDLDETFLSENLPLCQSEYILVPHDLCAACQSTLVGQIFDFVVEDLTHAPFGSDPLQELLDLLVGCWHFSLDPFAHLELSFTDYVQLLIALTLFH